MKNFAQLSSPCPGSVWEKINSDIEKRFQRDAGKSPTNEKKESLINPMAKHWVESGTWRLELMEKISFFDK